MPATEYGYTSDQAFNMSKSGALRASREGGRNLESLTSRRTYQNARYAVVPMSDYYADN
jgi:hypothetical protein